MTNAPKLAKLDTMDKQSVSARRVALLDGDAEAFARKTQQQGVVELVIVGEDGRQRPVLVLLLPASTRAAA